LIKRDLSLELFCLHSLTHLLRLHCHCQMTMILQETVYIRGF